MSKVITFSATITGAQAAANLLRITAPVGQMLRVTYVSVAPVSAEANAQANISLNRASAVSAGSAVSPAYTMVGSVDFGGAVAQGPTATLTAPPVVRKAANLADGWSHKTPVYIEKGSHLVIRLDSALDAATDLQVYVELEQL